MEIIKNALQEYYKDENTNFDKMTDEEFESYAIAHMPNDDVFYLGRDGCWHCPLGRGSQIKKGLKEFDDKFKDILFSIKYPDISEIKEITNG